MRMLGLVSAIDSFMSDGLQRRRDVSLRRPAESSAWSLCVLLCLACWCNRAHAQAPCSTLGKACPMPLNMESARGLALGTAQRAGSISTSALAYNPAALVVGRLYHLEGVVDYMPDMATVALGGAVVDSQTARFGAGFAMRGFLSGDKGLDGVDGRLGLALPLTDSISLGVSGRYVHVNGDIDTTVGPTHVHAQGFTMDASLRLAPIPEVQIDVAAYNFINRDSYSLPVMIGGGAALALGEIAVVGGDLLVDLTSFRDADFTFGGGAEVFAGRAVPLRAGYSYDTRRKQNTISFGLGYTDATIGVDVSLRQQIGGEGDTRLIAGFRYYVH
jgi:hypothetical protein